jgi:hypothetical protein
MQTSTPISLLFGAQHFDALHPRNNQKTQNPRVSVSRNRGKKSKILFLGHPCRLPPKGRR